MVPTDSNFDRFVGRNSTISTTNEIGVIGCDLFFVRLDATTGKEKWRTQVNGASEYTQIAPYAAGFLFVITRTVQTSCNTGGNQATTSGAWSSRTTQNWLSLVPKSTLFTALSAS